MQGIWPLPYPRRDGAGIFYVENTDCDIGNFANNTMAAQILGREKRAKVPVRITPPKRLKEVTTSMERISVAMKGIFASK